MGGGKTKRGKATRSHPPCQTRLVDRLTRALTCILIIASLMTTLGGPLSDGLGLAFAHADRGGEATLRSVIANRRFQFDSGGEGKMRYSETFVGRSDDHAIATKKGYVRTGKPLTH